jgi:tetrahydrodipicolinate N-succinyltransferase
MRDSHNQGASKGIDCNITVRTHPTKNENRIYLLLHSMAERFPSKEWHIFQALSAGVNGALEAGLQTTLPSPAGHVL